ncbi:hypothetical protein A1Q1_05434 [Trichosporon asahii var. asahii CBS 2479]|uniref:Uncharacterized protein n=1 Tax=Trichosporon asahii var. asahii (strain ATCC 90039 / CBS 2479 / JCM 2466 / KCTC 7840 / NBRC 103889/ NCYC 2677 / UAMH 7654) TaxID=1186058 RepID=J6ETH8_TRIAS|nr:hypothetical protein A1Q1_05434 [Trichosporon asahii var. asahii CBS 2479]EJT46052.1 hypothetical protein A1Q1_05434 [Trichosporon asahii var. asahii CBS 2479]
MRRRLVRPVLAERPLPQSGIRNKPLAEGEEQAGRHALTFSQGENRRPGPSLTALQILIAAAPARVVPATAAPSPITPREIRTLPRPKTTVTSSIASAGHLIRTNYLRRISPTTPPRPSLKRAFHSSPEGKGEDSKEPPGVKEDQFSIGQPPTFQRQPLPEIWRVGKLSYLETQPAHANVADGGHDAGRGSGAAAEDSMVTIELSSVRVGDKDREDVPLSPADGSNHYPRLSSAESSSSRSTCSSDCTSCRELREPAAVIPEAAYPFLPPPTSAVAPAHDAVYYTEDHVAPRRHPIPLSPQLSPATLYRRCNNPNCERCAQSSLQSTATASDRLLDNPSDTQMAGPAASVASTAAPSSMPSCMGKHWSPMHSDIYVRKESAEPSALNVNVTVNVGDGLAGAIKTLTEELSSLKVVLASRPAIPVNTSPALQKPPVVNESNVKTSAVAGPPAPPELPAVAKTTGAAPAPDDPCTPTEPKRASSGIGGQLKLAARASSPSAKRHHSTPPRAALREPQGPVSDSPSSDSAPKSHRTSPSESQSSYYSSSSDADTSGQT